MKREDLTHPEFGGNKWRKLNYNLQQARHNHQHTLLTFGGAWSNHIYATAAAGKYFGFKTIGLIRGENTTPLNPTLGFARDCGMQVDYLDRKTYRNKHKPEFIQSLKHRYGDFYLLPEGGSNQLALTGCREIVTDIKQPFDVICCACGTGATLAGIISALQPRQQAIGFSALKGGQFLNREISQFLAPLKNRHSNWHIETAYHFGGYARTSDRLFQFIRFFEQQYHIPLDCVYTAKMFYGLFDLIKTGYFPDGSRIVAIHTGGLQGNAGFAEKISTCKYV